MFYFDTNYLLLVMLPTLLLSGLAQIYVRSAYARWTRARNGQSISGVQVAQAIFQRTNVRPVNLEGTPGQLTDHFDPGKNVVRLSAGVAQEPSVASMAIVAHELGHVQQYQTGSGLIAARQFLVPAVRFSPMLASALLIAGFAFQITGLAWLGVAFFGVTTLFALLTLPVEIDASNRAMKLLDEAGLLTSEEDRRGARNVLNAAASTYLAAALTSVLQLLYYIMLVSGRSRRS
jgi:uncharacterized protein